MRRAGREPGRGRNVRASVSAHLPSRSAAGETEPGTAAPSASVSTQRARPTSTGGQERYVVTRRSTLALAVAGLALILIAIVAWLALPWCPC